MSEDYPFGEPEFDYVDAVTKIDRLRTNIEAALATEIRQTIEAAQFRHGLGIRRIDVEMVDVTAMGDPLPLSTVGRIRIEFSEARQP